MGTILASSTAFFTVQKPSKVIVDTSLDSLITEFLFGMHGLQMGTDVIFERVKDSSLSISLSKTAIDKLFPLPAEFKFDDLLIPFDPVGNLYVAILAKGHVSEAIRAMVEMNKDNLVARNKEIVVRFDDHRWVKTVSNLVQSTRRAKEAMKQSAQSGGHAPTTTTEEQAAA